MKRLTLIILVLAFVASLGFAQNVDDALRYSRTYYGGSARFMSMGGAFTALGGDLSSLGQNPAGIGVFRSSEISLSPQLFHINTSSSFNGNSDDFLYNFNLNQAGFVGNIIKNDNESGLITLNFGYSFNRTHNFNQTITIRGNSSNSSLADLWADQAEGLFKDELEDNAAEAFLAYNTWIIDTLSGYDNSYETVFSNYGDNFPSIYGQTLRRLITYEGSTKDHSLSIGGNYSNKLFFGATLGISRINFSEHYEHLETSNVALVSGFENFNYTLHYENTGTGYSLKLGTIIKPVEQLRIGLAFHSPTFYRMSANLYDNITAKFTNESPYEDSNSPMRYNYALSTPFRALAGVGLQIKKIGILSVDYEYVNYATAKFSETGDNYDYSEKNSAIKSTLAAAHNIRVGGEVRLSKLYLRGGYGYYGEAYKPGDLNEKQNLRSVSFGAGFREQNVYIDFGFTNLSNSNNYLIYDSSAGSAISNMSVNKNIYTVTLGYKFGY